MRTTHRKRLTRQAIDAVKPPKSGYVTWYDTEEPDLGIRINAGGRRTWFVLVSYEGTTTRATVGKYPSITPELARKKAKGILKGVLLDDQTPREAAAERRAEVTLRRAFDLYREKRFVAHKRSTGNIDSMTDLYLAPWLDWRLSQITRGHVEHLHADIPNRKRRRWKVGEDRKKALVDTDQNCTGSMANHVLQHVRAVFNFARSYYTDGNHTPLYAGPNPADGIEKHDEESVGRRVRHDEVKRFFAALMAEPNRDFRDWVLVALWAGARSGNTRAMRWADLDLESGEWTFTVRKGRPKKSGEVRTRKITLALASPLLALLKERRTSNKGEWVFPAETREGYMGIPKDAWAKLLKRAKVTSLRMHDLRHSAASWAADSGASGPLLQAMLAHADPKTTQRYTHLHASVVRQAADAMANLMLEKAGVTAAEITKH